jgi:BirA family biotin operon repressor/biotin-[acetyl-CoA-carboxylase] ligase
MVSRVATPRANSPYRISKVSVTGSTNADVLALARQGEPAGLVLAAGHQTAGRGRLDRRWEAPPGVNLLVSVLFRPAGPSSGWFRCATAVAVAAVDVCHDLGVPAGIKWPNDLVVGDDKLAGVLAETDGAGAVVVGLGCNVGWPAAGEYPGAVSLAALGVEVGVDALLDRLIDRLEAVGPDMPGLLDRYRERCATTGRDVHLVLPDGTAVDGRAAGVDDDGYLLVECAAAGGATAPEAGTAPAPGAQPAFVVRRFAVGDVVHARRR